MLVRASVGRLPPELAFEVAVLFDCTRLQRIVQTRRVDSTDEFVPKYVPGMYVQYGLRVYGVCSFDLAPLCRRCRHLFCVDTPDVLRGCVIVVSGKKQPA